jgi:recombination protein RecT
MATQALATRDTSDYGKLRTQLETRADDFKMALPAHITPEKFQRTVITAAQSNPDILKADRGSLITACMKAAQDGLLPDGREAALVTFNTRKKGDDGQWYSLTLAQYMPMVFGLRKKILQSGEISAIETNVVYRREVEEGHFVFEGGTEAMLRHRPMLDLTDEDLADDNIVAAYSVATMKDGSKSFEVMRRAEINKVRQVSQTGATGKTTRDGKAISPKGPWVDWFAEMARKTVMRRHSKTLPMSGDILDVEANDDALYARSAHHALAADVGGEPTLIPPTREQVGEVPHDPASGEVLDDDTNAELDREGLAAMARDAGEGPADEQRGESHTITADELIAEINRKELVADVNALVASAPIGEFDEEDRARVATAQSARIDALKGRK